MKFAFIKSSENHTYIFKKFLLFAVVLILCFQVIDGQCKLEKLKDEYSSSQTVYTKDVTLASVFPLIGSKKPWDLVMSFMLVDSSCTMIVTHQDQSYSSNLNYIYLKFKDGTVIKKENPLDAGTYNTGLGYRFASTAFEITKEDLMKLSSIELIKFQASLKNNINYPLVDEELKQKNSDKIRTNAACILDEFNLATSKSEKKVTEKKISNEAYDFKCGYEMDKVDGFTKKRNVISKAGVFFDAKLSGGGHTFFEVCGTNIDGVNGLKFYYCITKDGISSYDDSQLATFKPVMLFDQVEILLENDEPISFKTNDVAEFLFQPKTNGIFSFKQFSIENDSIWQKIKTTPIKTVRVSLSGKELWTQDVDNFYSTSIMKVINCIDDLNIPKRK